MSRAPRVLKSRAIRAAGKKLDIIPDRQLQENLEWASEGTLADAYRIGAEEAQREIIARLEALEP